jgi:ADP-dependent phosphofructokinase/glucokinase
MSFILKEKKIHLHYCYYYFLAIYLKKRKKERKKERKKAFGFSLFLVVRKHLLI